MIRPGPALAPGRSRRPTENDRQGGEQCLDKAYSAASLTLARKENSTKAGAERMAKSPATTVPSTPLPNVVTYAVGGVTIMAGGAPIGAIGVSGAPAGQFDEDCARAAIAKIQQRLK